MYFWCPVWGRFTGFCFITGFIHFQITERDVVKCCWCNTGLKSFYNSLAPPLLTRCNCSFMFGPPFEIHNTSLLTPFPVCLHLRPVFVSLSLDFAWVFVFPSSEAINLSLFVRAKLTIPSDSAEIGDTAFAYSLPRTKHRRVMDCTCDFSRDCWPYNRFIIPKHTANTISGRQTHWHLS